MNIGILFLIFNRPDTTSRVFEKIRKFRPSRLYISADGSRNGYVGDTEKVEATRKIITQVDWPCELHTLLRDHNLGCKQAVSQAITWFFEHEDEGIILEDDCLPHQDFFTFCESMLDHYRNEDRVMVITGNNFQNGKKHGKATYYFSKYNHCWGWATWRRAWDHYQGEIPFWPKWKKSTDWRHICSTFAERVYWTRIFNKVYQSKIDTWDYPWTASVWYRKGLTVTPNVNLVSNIGFGQEATHTKKISDKRSNLPVSTLGTIEHPQCIKIDYESDFEFFNEKLLTKISLLKALSYLTY